MTKAKEAKYWDAPLNFMTGCTKVSPGCDNCWAESAHEARRKALLDPTNKFVNEMYRKPFGEIQLFRDKLAKGIPDGKPKTYFVDNMGDLFHPDIPFEFLHQVLWVIFKKPQHRFLILTKRPKRMLQIINERKILSYVPKNIWLGLTVCNQPEADQNIIHLLRTPAVNRWLSIEPMLSEIKLSRLVKWDHAGPGPDPHYDISYLEPSYYPSKREDLQPSFINWVVIGCESGKNRRPCKLDWVYSIVDQCQNAGVKYFIKQLDIGGKCVRDIEQFPKDLQTRDVPDGWGVSGWPAKKTNLPPEPTND